MPVGLSYLVRVFGAPLLIASELIPLIAGEFVPLLAVPCAIAVFKLYLYIFVYYFLHPVDAMCYYIKIHSRTIEWLL